MGRVRVRGEGGVLCLGALIGDLLFFFFLFMYV